MLQGSPRRPVTTDADRRLGSGAASEPLDLVGAQRVSSVGHREGGAESGAHLRPTVRAAVHQT